jgi:hypothetical protein
MLFSCVRIRIAEATALFNIAKGSSLRHSHHSVLVPNHQRREDKFELLVVQCFLVGNLFELKHTHRGEA